MSCIFEVVPVLPSAFIYHSKLEAAQSQSSAQSSGIVMDADEIHLLHEQVENEAQMRVLHYKQNLYQAVYYGNMVCC